jgi:hypothetical protein
MLMSRARRHRGLEWVFVASSVLFVWMCAPTLEGRAGASELPERGRWPSPSSQPVPRHESTTGRTRSTHALPEPLRTSAVRQVIIDNRVTDGPAGMREDSPAYLSTRPANYCKLDGCELPGTEMGTGTPIMLVCQAQGDRTTNGEDASVRDDSNPGLYSSSLWYAVRSRDGRLGFISEVWIEPSGRGGLELPYC